MGALPSATCGRMAESDYIFSTPEKLMADFEADIARWNHDNSHS